MILKLKDYHKTDKNYKKFSNNSSQNWDLMIKVLGSWGYINEIQTGIFKKFLRYRNESVHFNKCHPFKNKEDIILEDFTKLFNGLFGIFERRDIIKSVPGEFWIRPDMMGNPFVKEFFIPSGYQSAYMGNIFDDLYSEESVKPGKLSEEEFFSLRNEHGEKQQNKEIIIKPCHLYGYNVSFRII